MASCLTIDADGFGISVASESACIAQQGGCTLRLLHLVEHRTFYFTRDVDQCLVGADGDDVVVLQSHVTAQLTIQQEVIDVDIAQQLAMTKNLHVAQRTNVVGATCHVEGVVDGGKG